MRDETARTFIEEFTLRIEPVDVELGLADWRLNVTGDERYKEEATAARMRWMELFSDPHAFATISDHYRERAAIADPLLRRQVDLLYRMFAEQQFEPHEIE